MTGACLMPEANMKTFYELVVVIPVGPACHVEFIADTIRSVLHYTAAPPKIILADDSQKGTGESVRIMFPDTEVVASEKSLGKLCGLYINLSNAYQYALNNYSFDALLRLDTDALVIGNDPAREAINLFKQHPEIGLAGQYPNDYNGNEWDKGWPRFQLSRFTHILKMWKHAFINIPLRKYYRRAVKHGYIMGESVFGGSYIFSEKGLQKLSDAKLLPANIFKTLDLEEDHLFSLLIKSVDMHFGDLSSGDKPFACSWKGLPDSPEHLHKNGKKIIHSVRYYNNMKEPEIRTYFKQIRKLESLSVLT